MKIKPFDGRINKFIMWEQFDNKLHNVYSISKN